MRSEARLLRICRVLILLNICFIWGNSLLPGEISGAFSDWVKQLLESIFPGDGMETPGGGLLRKLAHFAEFTALGFLLSLQFRLKHHKIWYTVPLGMLTAGIDETIQMFVPDRGPALLDVGIDSCGVLVGMLLLNTAYFLRRKQTKNFGG